MQDIAARLVFESANLHDRLPTVIKDTFESHLTSSYGFTAHITRLSIRKSALDAPNESESTQQGLSTAMLKQVVAHCWNVSDIALASVSLSTLVGLSHVCGPALVSLIVDESFAYERCNDETMVLLRFPSLRQLRIGSRYSVAQAPQLDRWTAVRFEVPSLVELELLSRYPSATSFNDVLPALVHGKCVATFFYETD